MCPVLVFGEKPTGYNPGPRFFLSPAGAAKSGAVLISRSSFMVVGAQPGILFCDHPNQAGRGSKRNKRRVRDGLTSERLGSNLRPDGAGRLLGSKSSQHVDTYGRVEIRLQSGSLPERALSPKTSYGTAVEAAQVPRPIQNL